MNIHSRNNRYILTHSGRPFDFDRPDETPASIEAIAHALSHICRFGGHTRRFYSVAEHSFHCSHIVPAAHAYAALMHDIAEAFLGDIPSPLKQMLPDYRALYSRIETALFADFEVPAPLPDEVKIADLRMLAAEKRDLMPADSRPWPVLEGIAPPAGFQITGMRPELAKARFLARYHELRGE